MINRKNLICLLAILVTLTFIYPSSFVMACDCVIPENANEAMDKAAAVFRGEVLQIRKERVNGESYQAAIISVSEIWKGIDETQVLVYTDWASSCQFDFVVGEEYLLYPYESDGKL